MVKKLFIHSMATILGSLIGGLAVMGIFFIVIMVKGIDNPFIESNDWSNVHSNAKMIIVEK